MKVKGLTPLGFSDLRTKTATYLRENMNDFLPFLANSESEDLLTPEEYEKYCDNVAKTSAWGGAVEVCKLISKFDFERKTPIYLRNYKKYKKFPILRKYISHFLWKIKFSYLFFLASSSIENSRMPH